MPFELPTFNLTIDIYTGPWLTKSHRLSSLGNFSFGRRIQQFLYDNYDPEVAVASVQTLLLLPPLTDVRSRFLGPHADLLEIPSGSGRWYSVGYVEDIGKGFANEHRAAGVFQINSTINNVTYAGLNWPVPMP
jgi:hypothetical protein